MIKQFFKNLLTKIFGYKYYLVVYKIKIKEGFTSGNRNFRVKRLHKLELNFVKKHISEHGKYKEDNIIILNAIKINKPINDIFEE